AEPLYQRSLKIREAKLGPEHPDVAQSLESLANLYTGMGKNDEAKLFYERSLKILEAKRGPDHPDVATSLNNLAILYNHMGQYAPAELLYQRSLNIREAKLGSDHLDVAASLNNLAALYCDMGQYARAEPLHQRSLRIREANLGPDHPDVAASLNNLAMVYWNFGQYAQVEPLYQRSLKIYEAKLGPDHPNVAYILNNLAILYKGLGQYAQAEPLYQRSLKIKEAKLGPDHPEVAGSLLNFASLYIDMGKNGEAKQLYQRSLKIFEAKLGRDHPAVGSSLNGLAVTYVAMGQYAQAEPLYQRSLKIRETKLGPDHPDLAQSLNNLAALYWHTGQYTQAEPLYQRSIKIYEANLGKDHPVVAEIRSYIAALYVAMNEHEKATMMSDLARRAVRNHVSRVLPVLTAREQLTFIEHTDRRDLQAALTIAWMRPKHAALAEQSAGWLFNGKAVVHESLAEQARSARDSQDPQLAEQIKRLTAVRGELAALSQAAPKPAEEEVYRTRLAKLGAEEQELSRQINLADGRPALDEPWIEAAAVRDALGEDTVLVDIVRLKPFVFEARKDEKRWQPAHYVAWAVPSAGKGDVRIVDLGDAAEIDSAVEAARKAIEKSVDEKRAPDNEERVEQTALAALTAVAKGVLHSLLPAIADAHELILSPDSQLWLVPWAALPVDEGEYAIERWKLRYVTSGRDVVLGKLAEDIEQRQSSRPRIFADPDFNLDGKASEAATRAVLRGKEKDLATRSPMGLSQGRLSPFGRLKETANEAKLITPALQKLAHEPPTVYSEQYAQEGVLKMIASPRALVLSTHGFYFSDQEVKPDDDRGMLASVGDNEHRGAVLATDGAPLENPLLRCGLALAGCNKPRGDVAVDDGILTGMEIVGLDLRGTDLVVLSACDTGIGQVRNGEGVAGLRQAFQLAGAKAVVSTLWKIPNKETVELMTDFFNNLAAGQSKAEALRNAQLAQIKTRRHEYGAAHPYYWAAFTVTGN
ncbi:MAG TPA: CHAT domain-containing tetratricopeptide repeat protein, partial [Pirellulales bacterium]|nr:CHAT domain-containing tetratricopeptide repeat protein [Pirellulales bacterium]